MPSSPMTRPPSYPPSPTFEYDERYRPLQQSGSMQLPRHDFQYRENVGQGERVGSLLAGAAMFAAGLKRGHLGGWALAALGGSLMYRAFSGHCYLYDSLGIDTAERRPQAAVPHDRGIKVERSLVINRSADELYAFWREFENLPTVMRHLQRVETLDAKRSRWTVSAPAAQTVQWDAEIINDREGEMIAWRSLPDSTVDTAGSIHFKPLEHDRGTAVTVALQYDPPAGKVGDFIAWLFGENASQQIDEDLRRFKQTMEAGEVATASTTGGPQR